MAYVHVIHGEGSDVAETFSKKEYIGTVSIESTVVLSCN